MLANLHLGAGPMALSILGFNLGIEAMQLFVVVLVMPWLVLISQTKWYTLVRIVSAVLAGITALAWIAERISGDANVISNTVLKVSQYAVWGIAGLAFLSLTMYAPDKIKMRFYMFNQKNNSQ